MANVSWLAHVVKSLVSRRKGPVRNISHTEKQREIDVAWSPNGKYIAYYGDNAGEYELYIQN